MRIVIATVANKAPGWVEAGYREYEGRIRAGVVMEHQRVAPARYAGRKPLSDRLKDEADRLRKAIPRRGTTIALDSRGKQITTPLLVEQLQAAMMQGRDFGCVIGGADGLHPDLLDEAAAVWSLGVATYPHHLVRILVAEQLYRAWSVLHNLPYHQEH